MYIVLSYRRQGTRGSPSWSEPQEQVSSIPFRMTESDRQGADRQSHDYLICCRRHGRREVMRQPATMVLIIVVTCSSLLFSPALFHC